MANDKGTKLTAFCERFRCYQSAPADDQAPTHGTREAAELVNALTAGPMRSFFAAEPPQAPLHLFPPSAERPEGTLTEDEQAQVDAWSESIRPRP